MIVTMNISVVLLVALALTGATIVNAIPVGKPSELHDVFEEFRALVPRQKVAAIVTEYLLRDAEVQTAVKYVQGDGFKDLVTKTEKISDVIKFYRYLNESGLDIYGSVNKLHEAIGLPPLRFLETVPKLNITGGASGLIADIKALLPIDKIKALYDNKLSTSRAFAQLVQRMKSPEMQKLVDALRANDEFQKMLKFAKDVGIDVKAMADLIATMFGLKFPKTPAVVDVDTMDNLIWT